MKLICAGFWKTGTKSLARALEILDYKVYDYDYQLFELSELWDKFVDGTVTDDDIREALRDVDAIIDGPVLAYWEEISRAIPEAKVILTIREEDAWWNSFKGMMKSMPWSNKIGFVLGFFCPSGRSLMRNSIRFANLCTGVEGPFRLSMLTFDDNPRMYKYMFRKHNCHVLHTVPKDKLLVYEPGSGWAPLCKFLGKEVPDVSYPFKNKDGAHFKTEGGPQHPGFKRIMVEAGILLAILIALFSVMVYYLLSYIFN